MIDLDATRTKLVSTLSDTLGRHARIDAHLHQAGGALPADWEEQAVALENDEVLAHLDDAARAEIAALRAAIRRIDAGTYGACGACGEDIEPRRLEALPTTSLCLSCAQDRA